VLAARAAELATRYGFRPVAGTAVFNQTLAYLHLGQWDRAVMLLDEAVANGMDDLSTVLAARGWLSALRGDLPAARSIRDQLEPLRLGDNPQDNGDLATLDALLAAASRDDHAALAAGLEALKSAPASGISSEFVRWGWPVAARAAAAIGDDEAVDFLLGVLDAHPVGHLPPIVRAERDLAVAKRLVTTNLTRGVDALDAAIVQLRAAGSPYHLAHALLDRAELTKETNDVDSSSSDVIEARDIAQQLTCQPIIDRLTKSPSRAASPTR
jgi:tetratricopeptide (TPR) repeat protein